tara:strand:+ start:784 stop:1152 length:369 start_codon:yes stop_codon:yes gene_type:complete
MINTCLSLALALGFHFGLDGDYNNVHPHLRCDVNNTIAGVYYNSEENISAYVGYVFDMPLDSELEVGWVTGYSGFESHGLKIAPMLRLTKGNWYLAPAYEATPNKNWGVTIGYEFNLLGKGD